MAIPTTIDIPEHLHERLAERAKARGVPIAELILESVKVAFPMPGKGKMITGPFIKGPLNPGPEFPTDENPHDLAFS